MSEKKLSTKAVARGASDPGAFERTLAPNDPRANPGGAGYVIRDNRNQRVLNLGTSAAHVAETPPPGSLVFGDTPVSGIIRKKPAPAVEIPIARITRDESDAMSRDTRRDVEPPFAAELPVDSNPDFASDYVPPQPLPPPVQHKTFELAAVQLDPEVHPRTAPTVLNARTHQRHAEKRQKDADDVARLVVQSERRRRGPWVVAALVLVVGLGFGIGSTFLNSTEATASAGEPELESPATAALHAEPSGLRAGSPDTANAAEPAPPAAAAPEPQPERSPAAPKRAASQPAVDPDERREPESAAAQPEPAREVASPAEPAKPSSPKPPREVWLE